VTIEQWFSESFFETNFWYLWRSMFAFENWQSLLEMKLYMHRFLDAIDGLTDMSALVFPKYNQYDSFAAPLTRMLQDKGVRFQFATRSHDLDMVEEEGNRRVTAIRCKVEDARKASRSARMIWSLRSLDR
jgi:oleate hydratase